MLTGKKYQYYFIIFLNQSLGSTRFPLTIFLKQTHYLIASLSHCLIVSLPHSAYAFPGKIFDQYNQGNIYFFKTHMLHLSLL